MQKVKVFILTLILSISFLAFQGEIFAQEGREALESQLSLKIPEQTDNPNFALVFVDPSEQGVFLEIDGNKQEEIRSPYQLPSLGIGSHTLLFTYTDAEETEVSQEVSLVITPRPPQIDTPQIGDNTLIITGTALPDSHLYLFLSGSVDPYRQETEVDQEGMWKIELEGDFSSGIYNMVAYVTRNGYGSMLSEPVTFSLESNKAEVREISPNSIHFSFNAINSGTLAEDLSKNQDLLILVGGVFLVGALLSVLFYKYIILRSDKKLEDQFKRMLTGAPSQVTSDDDKKKEEPTSIKSKLGGLGKRKEMKKEDFLAQFKDEDPDPESNGSMTDKLASEVDHVDAEDDEEDKDQGDSDQSEEGDSDTTKASKKEGEAETESDDDLEQLTVPQLKELASKKGVEFPGKIRKAKLIKLLRSLDEEEEDEDDEIDDEDEAEEVRGSKADAPSKQEDSNKKRNIKLTLTSERLGKDD